MRQILRATRVFAAVVHGRVSGLGIGLACAGLLLGCGTKDAEPPPAQPVQPGYGQPPGAYPAQQPYPAQQQPYPAQQQYPAQQPYPAQPAPGYPAPQPSYPAPATTAPGAAGTAAPMGFPCTNDVPCLAHRCNVAAGRCAFPCQSSSDCMPGFQCITPACIPGAPAQ
jgi:hypothetical protein